MTNYTLEEARKREYYRPFCSHCGLVFHIMFDKKPNTEATRLMYCFPCYETYIKLSDEEAQS